MADAAVPMERALFPMGGSHGGLLEAMEHLFPYLGESLCCPSESPWICAIHFASAGTTAHA